MPRRYEATSEHHRSIEIRKLRADQRWRERIETIEDALAYVIDELQELKNKEHRNGT